MMTTLNPVGLKYPKRTRSERKQLHHRMSLKQLRLIQAEKEWIAKLPSTDYEPFAITILFHPTLYNPAPSRVEQSLRHVYNVIAKCIHSHPTPLKSPTMILWPDLPSPQTKKVYADVVDVRSVESPFRHIDKLDRFGMHYQGFLLVPKAYVEKFTSCLLAPDGPAPADFLRSSLGTKIRKAAPSVEGFHIKSVHNARDWHSYCRKSIPKSELAAKEFLILSITDQSPSQARRRSLVRRQRRMTRNNSRMPVPEK
jgi:hypothetical protein